MTTRRRMLATLLAPAASFLLAGKTMASRDEHGRHLGTTQTRDDALALTTSIVGERYCKGDAEVSTLLLSLRLRYTNRGWVPLILYKGSGLVNPYTVSRTVEDALARRYEMKSSWTVYATGVRRIIEGREPDRLFTVIRPGASFETESNVAVAFMSGDATDIPGAVAKGTHVLRSTVVTWPESEQLAERLAQRWSHRGRLWHEPVESAPMPFKIEPPDELRYCS